MRLVVGEKVAPAIARWAGRAPVEAKVDIFLWLW